ncbi:MAG: hypothetical protein WBQ44_12660, partial [Rhodococcus sp. (in: high G+C Gram-positive bacteria)]
QRATDRTSGSDTALLAARSAASRLARLFTDATTSEDTDSAEMDRATIELVSYSAFGAVASATDWWLGSSDRAEPAMTIQTFSAYVAAQVSGLVESSCALAGVTIETDQPMHTAFSRAEGEQHP